MEDGKLYTDDKFVGNETMENVHDKKYLGKIISFDMKNKKNIKETRAETAQTMASSEILRISDS